jgi:hypothetical protein
MKNKIKSGQGSQREARYPDELVDCLSAARRTPTPTPTEPEFMSLNEFTSGVKFSIGISPTF